jgi:hypothetical protein
MENRGNNRKSTLSGRCEGEAWNIAGVGLTHQMPNKQPAPMPGVGGVPDPL